MYKMFKELPSRVKDEFLITLVNENKRNFDLLNTYLKADLKGGGSHSSHILPVLLGIKVAPR